MTIDQIRKIHYKQKGKEEGIKELILRHYKKGLSVEYIAEINELDVEYIKSVLETES